MATNYPIAVRGSLNITPNVAKLYMNVTATIISCKTFFS